MSENSKKTNNRDFKLYVSSVADNSTTLKISDLPYVPKTREQTIQKEKLKSHLLLGTLMFF